MRPGSLAHKLQLLRAERGLTLVQAAMLTGVTRGTLSELESAKRAAYMPTLSKIAEGYGVDVRELLLEEPVPLDETPLERRSRRDAKTLTKADQGPPELRDEDLREADELVDMDVGEAENLLRTLSLEELIERQRQLFLILRYRYAPIETDSREEMIAYIQSEEKKRGDRVGERLRKVTRAIEARVDEEIARHAALAVK